MYATSVFLLPRRLLDFALRLWLLFYTRFATIAVVINIVSHLEIDGEQRFHYLVTPLSTKDRFPRCPNIPLPTQLTLTSQKKSCKLAQPLRLQWAFRMRLQCIYLSLLAFHHLRQAIYYFNTSFSNQAIIGNYMIQSCAPVSLLF